MRNLAVEYECRADIAAERLAAARVAVREAKARLSQARLLYEIEPSDVSRRALLEAEFEAACATRNEIALLPKSSDAHRVTQ